MIRAARVSPSSLQLGTEQSCVQRARALVSNKPVSRSNFRIF